MENYKNDKLRSLIPNLQLTQIKNRSSTFIKKSNSDFYLIIYSINEKALMNNILH